MLITLRRGFQENGLKIILWFTIVVMGIGLLAPLLMDRTTSKMGPTHEMAVINGKAVDYRVVTQRIQQEEDRIQLLRQQLGGQFDQFAHLLGLENIPQRTIESVIQEELVGQAAYDSSLYPNHEYIVNRLHDPEFALKELSPILPFYVLNQQTGTIDPALLTQYLQKFGLTLSQFEESIEQIVASSLLYNILSSTVFVSPLEIRTRYVQNYVPRIYELLTFSLDHYKKEAQKLPVSQQELKDFAKQQIKTEGRYIVPEKRTGTIWSFDVKSYDIQPSDKALEHYYAKHKFNKYVKTPAQVQVREITLPVDFDQTQKEAILQELQQAPGLFKEYAQKYSQSDTASRGGLMDQFKRGTHDPVFERKVFSIETVGDITSLQNEDGVTQIIQLEKRTPAEFIPFETVKSEIKDSIADERFADRFSLDIKNIIMQAQKDQQILSDFATKKKAKKSEFNLAGITEEPLLFNSSQRGMTYFVQGNTGTVVYITDIRKPYEPTFESIEETVKQDWYEQKAWEMLNNDLNEAAGLDQSFELSAKQYNANYKVTNWVDPQNQSDLEALNTQGIDPNSLLSLTQEGSTSEALSENNGYLIRLKEVGALDSESLEEHKTEIYGLLTQEKKELVQRDFVASLLRNATITYNDSFNN